MCCDHNHTIIIVVIIITDRYEVLIMIIIQKRIGTQCTWKKKGHWYET